MATIARNDRTEGIDRSIEDIGDRRVVLDTIGSAFDTALYLRTGACRAGRQNHRYCHRCSHTRARRSDRRLRADRDRQILAGTAGCWDRQA